MSERPPAPAWLRWLLLAVFASCLNPKPDDEPLSTPVGGVPVDGEPSGAGKGSVDDVPILIGDDDNQPATDNGQQTPSGIASNGVDAGVPSGDAGTTSGDAGPL